MIDPLQNESADGPLPIATGERMVFLVPSDHNPAVRYRVDLTANNGAGWCECPDFSTRRQPNLEAGLPTLLAATTCKHVRRSWRFVDRRIAADIARSESP